MRMVATVVALSFGCLANAQAQSTDWIVLPTTSEENAPWMEPTVRDVGRALRRHGVGVWSPGAAVVAFEHRGSAAPKAVSESQIEAWAAQSQQALRRLANGEYATAVAEFKQVQQFSSGVLETLNRDPQRAKTVLDNCLYLMRALTHSDEPGRANRQAEECVRLVPSMEPTWDMHPPSVAELYQAAAQPGPRHASSLLVESEPRACELRLNGVLFGPTPVEVANLYPGKYRVQVECDPDSQARVHVVDIPKGATSVFVFDRFDRAVRTSPGLHLQYDVRPDADRLARDAREVGRILPAVTVVTASVSDAADVLELRAVTAAQAEPLRVRIPIEPTGPEPATVFSATSALLSGECRDFTEEVPFEIDCRTGKRIAPPHGSSRVKTKAARVRPPRPQFLSGIALASVGTASLVSSYALLVARRSAGDDWIASTNSLSAQDKWLHLGTGLTITGPVGGALLAAAMPLVLPYQAKTPWWSWLSGALGLAAAAGSIASGVIAPAKPPTSCTLSGPDPAPCVNRGRDIDRAVVLAATAAPLLTMPLVYLLRRDKARLRAELAPRVSFSRQGGTLGIHGSF